MPVARRHGAVRHGEVPPPAPTERINAVFIRLNWAMASISFRVATTGGDT
jgi:hypothetical protein